MSASEQTLDATTIEAILSDVKDPEIPVISIRDLGILQNIAVNGRAVRIAIIPTYSGCPAMYTIQAEIKKALLANQIDDVTIELVDKPVWNTEMITAKGRAAMQAYGIAPPSPTADISCPQCGSKNTTCISQFGSTACKALYRCEDCLEPFDYFKCHA